MPGEDGDQERTSHRLVLLVVVGLMVGLGAGTVAAWSLSGGDGSQPPVVDDDPGPPTSLPETPEAAEAFLSAWERSRREDYIVVSQWHRSTTAGATATETRILAQRLPDRIRAGADSRSGRIGNSIYTCDRLPISDEQLEAGDLTAEVECRSQELDPTTDQVDVEAMVAEELALMRRHVEGTYPLYRVSRQDDCFFLRLARQMVVPPYGFRTTYCFDAESGAVRSLKVERAEGVDTEDLTWVTSEVTDADLIAVIEGTFTPPS